MRYFVTGATGWIGSLVVAELKARGHDVVGLARTDDARQTLEEAGVEPWEGDLTDPGSLAAGAGSTDGVVHLAYHHDFTQMEEAARLDRAAIEAMGAALEGSGRPLLIASGTLGLAPGRVGTEHDMPAATAHPRSVNAEATLALADRGVRSLVVRFAPTVHGAGDHGFVATLVQVARERGVSAYIGEGTNRWPAVHRHDAARLVRLALEDAPAGSVLHAVAEEGVETRAIAEAIGTGLDLPVRSVPAEDAVGHFGWIGPIFAADAPAANEITSSLLGWEPREIRLIDDVALHYTA